MSKDDSRKGKSRNEHTKGRSFCCSMFIYTFVFVSGVVVATILPALAGHHFKQPYGEKYGVMIEEIIKDLPKHLKSLSETAVVLGHELVDRVWDLKAEIERRVADMNNKKEDTIKTNTATERPTTSRTTTRTPTQKDDLHTKNKHDTIKTRATANDGSSRTNDL